MQRSQPGERSAGVPSGVRCEGLKGGCKGRENFFWQQGFFGEEQAKGGAEGFKPSARGGGSGIGQAVFLRRPFHKEPELLMQFTEFGIGGGGGPTDEKLFTFAEFFYLPDTQEQFVIAGLLAQGAGEDVVEAVAVGRIAELAEVVGRPLGAEDDGLFNGSAGRLEKADRGDWRVMRRKIKGFREPERDRAGEPAELVFRLGLGGKEVGVSARQSELSESDATKAATFSGEYFLGEGLEAVEPDGFTDADKIDLGDDGFGRGERRGISGGAMQRKRRSTGNDQLGDGVREAMEPIFEFGAIEFEEDVEDVLRGIGLAKGEIGLEKIEARSGAVFLGIVTRGDEFDDAGDVAGGSEVA